MATDPSSTSRASADASASGASTRSAPRGSTEATLAAAELDRLMDRYADGDQTAFAPLHKVLAPRLRMFLLRLCGKPRLADDLLQDTFLRIHRARGSFSRGAAALPWAYAVARNVYVDHGRRARERFAASVEDISDGAQPAATSGGPDEDLVAKQSLEIVRATLAGLPAAHREAFILIRFEGLSVAEAAQVLGASEANVKVRAFRAYEAFRAALKKGDERP